MQALVLTIHVVLAMTVIGLVLLQQGKGADAGAAFGSGASSTVFGAQGSGSFLTRMTTLCAALFFATSLALAMIASNRSGESGSVIDQAPAEEQQQEQPAPGEAGPGDLPADGAGSGGTGDLPPMEGQ
ncbi:MAG: preprotein translocase subunit SecG [Halofilum sp. (in: g-proteobacteria)]